MRKRVLRDFFVSGMGRRAQSTERKAQRDGCPTHGFWKREAQSAGTVRRFAGACGLMSKAKGRWCVIGAGSEARRRKPEEESGRAFVCGSADVDSSFEICAFPRYQAMCVLSTGGTREYEDMDKKRYGEEWRYLWYKAVNPAAMHTTLPPGPSGDWGPQKFRCLFF